MSSTAAMPYIGSKISLVTNSELRYDGILVSINTTNSTVTLKDVRMSGTENRKVQHLVVPSSEVFDYIIFNGRDIKDLTVSEPAFSIKEDPAVVAINVPPNQVGNQGLGGHPGHMMGGHPGYPRDPAAVLMGPSQQNPGFGARFDSGSPWSSSYGPSMRQSRGGPIYMGRNEMGGGYMRGGMYGSPHPGMGGGRPMGSGGMMMGGGPRGGVSGGMNSGNGRLVVGELAAQPNSNLRTQVEQAFDFEQANKKFERTNVAEEHPEKESIKAAYNRGSSFFDNISCEALNRQQGRESRVDRDKQRELDTQTFGPAATLARGPRYRRGGFRRSGGMMAPGGQRGGRGGMFAPIHPGVGGGYHGGPFNPLIRAKH